MRALVPNRLTSLGQASGKREFASVLEGQCVHDQSSASYQPADTQQCALCQAVEQVDREHCLICQGGGSAAQVQEQVQQFADFLQWYSQYRQWFHQQGTS